MKKTPDTNEAAAASKAEQARVLLHMPVDVRSLSLAILATLGTIFMLQWAREVFIPILLGIMASYALTPVVDRLFRWHVPRAIGSAMVLLGIVGALGWGAWSMSDDATSLIESLPEVAQKLRQVVSAERRKPGDKLAKVQQAAAELAKAGEESQVAPPLAAASGASAGGRAAASGASAASAGPAGSATVTSSTTVVTTLDPVPTVTTPRTGRGRAAAAAASTPGGTVTRVVVEKPAIDIRDYLWTGTLGLMSFLGQAAIVFFITFFLLASGDSFRRKLVKLAGRSLAQKRITIQALDEITEQIQRYLLVQAATSLVLGVLIWLIFWWIGLQHAAVWGVFAAITNLIPYLGAIVLAGTSAVVGFIQFGALDMGLLVGGSSFVIHGLIGNLLTPWWTGRAGRMSPFVIFVGVLAFGWLWGVWGLLLGVPILMVVKAICDRVDELKPIGEFLGA